MLVLVHSISSKNHQNIFTVPKNMQIKIGLKRYCFLLERAKLYDPWPHRYKFVILLFAFFECFKQLAMFIQFQKIQIKIGLKRYCFLLERAKLYDPWHHRYNFVILLFAFFECFKQLAMFISLLVYFYLALASFVSNS